MNMDDNVQLHEARLSISGSPQNIFKSIIHCPSLAIIKSKRHYVTILNMKYCIQSNYDIDLLCGAPSHI